MALENAKPSTLLPYLRRIQTPQQGEPVVTFVLASQSPRRQQILQTMGITQIQVIPSAFEENLNKRNFEDARDYAVQTATQKLLDVFKRVTGHSTFEAQYPNRPCIDQFAKQALIQEIASSSDPKPAQLERNCIITEPFIIIAADTIVEKNGCIHEKPKTKQEAIAMLSELSGEVHHVHTGVALISCFQQIDAKLTVLADTTTVCFKKLSKLDIEAYVETRECYDKAGGYGMQGLGSHLVEHIRGSFFNAMGLPLEKLSAELSALFNSWENY